VNLPEAVTPSATPLAVPLGLRSDEWVADALRGSGLWIDLGGAVVRLRSPIQQLAGPLRSVYRHFEGLAHGQWADIHADIKPPRGLRRWLRPQAELVADGHCPFEPFPASHALPLAEWGVNWLIGQRLHRFLLLHAGVVERDGLALLLPATPGAGKSTLTVALALRGWRLMSDEFGALGLDDGLLRPMLKPPALKNASIDVISRFEPRAELGPSFPGTRKGVVAHLAPPAAAVVARHAPARPTMVILPRWQPAGRAVLEPVNARLVCSALAFNAFNYAVAGVEGFRAVTTIANTCQAWQLSYSQLDDAIDCLGRLWARARGGAAAAPLAAESV
jgi:HprK-related kinase A